MENKITLNANEKKALEIVIEDAMNETNGQFGYSEQAVELAVTKNAFTKNQMKGYLSALQSKGIITIDEECNQTLPGSVFDYVDDFNLVVDYFKEEQCTFCKQDDQELLYDVSYCRKGGNWKDAIVCVKCVAELREDKVEFGVMEPLVN